MYKVKQEPDDSNPTPYTGGGFNSSLVKPEKDNDTARLLPDVAPDGLGGSVRRGDPDASDDTGKFYGGIMGGRLKQHPDSGGARPIDPANTADVDN